MGAGGRHNTQAQMTRHEAGHDKFLESGDRDYLRTLSRKVSLQ